jgi:hypothetical protein
MKNNKIIIRFCFLVLVLVSCKTAEFGYKVVDVNGMIYDFSNRPIPHCLVTLGKNYNVSTDINGRFTLLKVPVGDYKITGEKKGYEPYIDTVAIKDKGQIIYIRMPSQNQLLEQADEALTNNDFVTAEAIIERAYHIDQNNIEMLFYYATVKFRKHEYDRAIAFLETAQFLGSKDIYIEKFLKELKELQSVNRTY